MHIGDPILALEVHAMSGDTSEPWSPRPAMPGRTFHHTVPRSLVWDINHDEGVEFGDYRGFHRAWHGLVANCTTSGGIELIETIMRNPHRYTGRGAIARVRERLVAEHHEKVARLTGNQRLVQALRILNRHYYIREDIPITLDGLPENFCYWWKLLYGNMETLYQVQQFTYEIMLPGQQRSRADVLAIRSRIMHSAGTYSEAA